ncbi:hypothetical protein D3C85_1678450 [compost metagenome]
MGFCHGRIEEEGQEGTRHQQDDEGIQRHLTEHERPVVGEYLPAELTQDAGATHALVHEVGETTNLGLRNEGGFSC